MRRPLACQNLATEGDCRPYPDPYILLPLPELSAQETRDWREIGAPLGAFVFGRRAGGHVCSSAAEQRQDLGLMFTNIARAPGGR